MLKPIIRFFNLVLAGLVAGIVLGIWLGYNPAAFSAQTYIEQQQHVISALNTLMPVLGLIAIVLTILSAFLQRDRGRMFWILLAAAGLLIISGLVTRFGNQPINAVVMTWDAADAPGNWAELRDRWWSFHTVRMLTSLLAFCLIGWAHMRRV